MIRRKANNQAELFPAHSFHHDRFFFERQAMAQGANKIAGVDEAGRGPLSGPVVAAAVILTHENHLDGIDDSKKLSPLIRESLFPQILDSAVSIGVGYVESHVIDRINILQATYTAMKTAIQGLEYTPDYVLVDGYPIPDCPIPQTALIKGDHLSITIGAASIIAKVIRDHIMVRFAQQYPEYGFEKNKGYGTPFHRNAIQKYGPCAIHRLSFRGVREFCKET
jgi:ribonuclease HII